MKRPSRWIRRRKVTLIVEGHSTILSPGDTFTVSIRLDANAAGTDSRSTGHIIFSKDIRVGAIS